MKVYDWFTYRGSGKAHAFRHDDLETVGWSRCGLLFLPRTDPTPGALNLRAFHFRATADADPRCGACQRGINREARQR